MAARTEDVVAAEALAADSAHRRLAILDDVDLRKRAAATVYRYVRARCSCTSATRSHFSRRSSASTLTLLLAAQCTARYQASSQWAHPHRALGRQWPAAVQVALGVVARDRHRRWCARLRAHRQKQQVAARARRARLRNGDAIGSKQQRAMAAQVAQRLVERRRASAVAAAPPRSSPTPAVSTAKTAIVRIVQVRAEWARVCGLQPNRSTHAQQRSTGRRAGHVCCDVRRLRRWHRCHCQGQRVSWHEGSRCRRCRRRTAQSHNLPRPAYA